LVAHVSNGDVNCMIFANEVAYLRNRHCVSHMVCTIVRDLKSIYQY